MTAQPLLRHSVVGPDKDGAYVVAYACDSTDRLTAVGQAPSKQAAEREAKRLDIEHRYRQEIIQMPRRLYEFRKAVD